MRYKGIEIVPVERPNEPYCNSCGDSGERWKIRFCLDEVGGSTVILCTDCLQALARMSFDAQEDNSLFCETVDLIKQIYAKYPVGGALHIVLDDNNVSDEDICWCMIHEVPKVTPEDLPLFEKCATHLVMLKTEQRRNECIQTAMNEVI